MRTRSAAGRGAVIEIALQNPNRYPEAAARRLRPWLGSLLAALAPAGYATLGVRFAGDRAMRQANRRFRGKDQTTDVLSFPGGDGPAGGDGHLGDILISVPAARRQAAAAGRNAEREIRVLLLHGVLHCLGHDHETDGGEMERLERRLRRRWIGLGAEGTAGQGAVSGANAKAVRRATPAGPPSVAGHRAARRGGRRRAG
jgi:probable rRNA maturation factor